MLAQRFRPLTRRRPNPAPALSPALALVLASGLALGLLPTSTRAQAADAATTAAAASPDLEALGRATAAVVRLRTQAVPDAVSADTLGQLREGSGVLISADGLVLTIGYLVLEAEQIDIEWPGLPRLPARLVAYDLATGFGLVQPLVPLPQSLQPVRLGNSATVEAGSPLLVVSGGEDGGWSTATVVSQRSFAGYWEYQIDGALFTMPARADHSGAALFNPRGELLGIGSLMVMDALGPDGPRSPGNMFVPVDLLKPILGELRSRGRSLQSIRPWLGASCVEEQGLLRVIRVAPDSPAELAGLRAGDRITAIDGTAPRGLADFYRLLWLGDSAEKDVLLALQRPEGPQTLRVQTVDRMKNLRRARGV